MHRNDRMKTGNAGSPARQRRGGEEEEERERREAHAKTSNDAVTAPTGGFGGGRTVTEAGWLACRAAVGWQLGA